MNQTTTQCYAPWRRSFDQNIPCPFPATSVEKTTSGFSEPFNGWPQGESQDIPLPDVEYKIPLCDHHKKLNVQEHLYVRWNDIFTKEKYKVEEVRDSIFEFGNSEIAKEMEVGLDYCDDCKDDFYFPIEAYQEYKNKK